MDDRLRAIAAQHGVFLRSEAWDCGYDDNAVRAALRAGLWVRVRHGAYCFAEIWNPLDAAGRHRIRAHAVLRSLGDRVALSHVSNLVDVGCDVWGVDLSRVHVTRLDGASGRVEGDVVHHEGHCLEGDVVERHGHLATVGSRAVVEAVSRMSTESGLVSADCALRLGITDPDELCERFRAMERWPFVRRGQVVIRMADGRAGSVGESRSRNLFWRENLLAPELQFEVYDAYGNLIGISDFAWPERRLLGEFDGRIKYGRLLKPGQEPGDVVFDEKCREDQMREATGFGMGRLIWVDLSRSGATGARFRRLLGIAA